MRGKSGSCSDLAVGRSGRSRPHIGIAVPISPLPVLSLLIGSEVHVALRVEEELVRAVADEACIEPFKHLIESWYTHVTGAAVR